MDFGSGSTGTRGASTREPALVRSSRTGTGAAREDLSTSTMKSLINLGVPPPVMAEDAAWNAGPTGFSSAKKSILLHLKRSPNATLSAVASALGVSRAAAWKHLSDLESGGLVEREYRRGRRGRPHACYRLTPSTGRLFPEAYAQLSLSALAFIERGMGREAVRAMLEERAEELRAKHSGRLAHRDLAGRVGELARIRDEEGYVATHHRCGRMSFELLEHNCPILAIAERFGEACEVERRLFRDLLGASVTVSHRAVAGDGVCRFLVRPPEAEHRA